MNLLITLIVIFSAPAASAINYFRCDATSDCVKAYGGCGRYFSVHRRYKELYEAKAHEGDKVTFCLKPTEIDIKVQMEGKALCQKNRCLLSLKKMKEIKRR